MKIAEYREYASVKPLDDIRVLTLEEAKGLEFDHVILVDVSKTALGETDLWRRRLYTAISRATKSFVALCRHFLHNSNVLSAHSRVRLQSFFRLCIQ